MPDQKNFAPPYDNSFEFEPGSSSSNSMNQQVLWNNMLFNPTEVQSMTGRITASGVINIPCLNMANQDDAQSSIWGSRGSSSSSQHHQQGIHEENKWEHGWAPSTTVTSRGGPRIEDNHSYGSPMLSLDTVSRSLNVAQVDGIQSFSQNNPWFNNSHQNRDITASQVGLGNNLSESTFSQPPYMLGFLDGESVSMPIDLSSGESSENVGLLREDDDRPENSLDGRRISCKRKNSEGSAGQSSVSGNASTSQQRDSSLLYSHIYNPVTTNISSSAGYPSIPLPPEEYPITLGAIARGVASDCYPSASAAGHAGTSRRNHRVRNNPALPHPNSWSVNTIRQPDSWLYNQPPLNISQNQSLEPTQILTPTSSQNQPLMPIVSGLPQIVYHVPWSGPSNSRIGTSSGSFSAEDRIVAATETSQSSNMPVLSNLELVPATSVRHMPQHRTNRSLGGRSVNMATNSQAGTSSGLYPTLASSWVPHQNPTQFPPLTEATYPSLFPPGSSESGGQGTNFPPLHSAHSFSSHEVAQIRASLRGPPPMSHARSPNLLRRRNHGLLGAPISLRSLTAAGEDRSRMLSEIRHALESLRRGDGLRFEDVFILDQTLILAGSDFHDRHRDMRLDVDNMSYEELLALEERIGNVCTGLTEEKVIKCLKQRKHSSTTLGNTMEHEPCCICQEEYVEGDGLGILDCGHDFHTACIKQWLMHKNLCPICKNTALHT
ncbi:probable E3 ubiquitin-protein ligase HIP1 isoform X1 [Zingiber officinale]|nr:probable E3 ubiquitin-protein ligase HIP1 isoform X1 [Zingiber officinale]XP_042442025.1 probable E3 ubiquitin-protein ligase HIP1 isoform X1 [Zingiber officinale]XP_042442032.1 probable E3 ubiquitin-protein ligase HIP1 isoform X1 [Zingiber officinale]XP_042442039.1 probable E3 ubiquitin-protein ligase HIP1 isoform X1 [Zingiber officinale]XP_042442046.1 probable E3 ubiquitin-protein ligase HIP1 isoform X1 [Zingiber officinale]XP_042442053.1 probable E3 ubiquitin-protein ligase HIP1 isoform 